MTVTISQIEKIEFDLVDALAGLPAAEQRLQTKVRDMLAKVRAKKRELLALAPDVLRKAAAVGRSTPAESRWFGLPCVEPEATEMVKAARDRQSEELRLAKASSRTRYRAPEHLRGSRMRLVDGRRLDIPQHGFCELGSGACPGYGPHAASAAHGQLLAAGFRVMPDEPDEALKRTLREQAIIGDRNLINFLNRRAGR
jgi:hypothetical protein